MLPIGAIGSICSIGSIGAVSHWSSTGILYVLLVGWVHRVGWLRLTLHPNFGCFSRNATIHETNVDAEDLWKNEESLTDAAIAHDAALKYGENVAARDRDIATQR